MHISDLFRLLAFSECITEMLPKAASLRSLRARGASTVGYVDLVSWEIVGNPVLVLAAQNAANYI